MAVKAPIVGGSDLLEDIAVFTGAKVISNELGYNL